MSAEPVGHVALVGLSGSGKSTVAPLLAARLGLGAPVDLDRVVESQAGRTVHEIFEVDGEATFRRLESDALADALAGQPVVIATGGGVVLDAANRQLLRSGATVVWLRGSPAHLAQRLADSTEARPLLSGDADFALHRLAEERDALYTEVADVVIDVDGVDPVTVADEVMGATR
ncbi:MAG: shikimate kinase [Microthrixaceae bacterium]